MLPKLNCHSNLIIILQNAMEESMSLEALQSLVPVSSLQPCWTTVAKKYWHIICRYFFIHLELISSSPLDSPVFELAFSSLATIRRSFSPSSTRFNPCYLLFKKTSSIQWSPNCLVSQMKSQFPWQMGRYLWAMEFLNCLSVQGVFWDTHVKVMTSLNLDDYFDFIILFDSFALY